MCKRSLLPILFLLISLPAFNQFSTSPQSLETHVYYLASDELLGRGFGTPQGKEAAAYIAEQFKEAGVEPYQGTYFHPFNARNGILNIPGINVVGIIPGSVPELKDEYIVLGAHYDHLGWAVRGGDTVVWNGADDNASGTATLIEIGRNLAARPESLGRSVVLAAFDGEESGLLGSSQILEDAVLPPHQVKLMFSLDMVGMYEAHGGLDMKGINLLHDAGYLTQALADQHHIQISKATRSIEQRTDTAPFGKYNIPAIAPSTGSESPYHQPEDTAAALDYEGMALITNYMSDVTQILSTRTELSSMTGQAEGETLQPKVFSAGLRWSLGTSRFNYLDDPYMGKSIFATQAGFFTSFRLGRLWYLLPEALYETKGSQYVGDNVRTHAVTLPLSLAISSPDDDFVRVWLQAGGYYSLHFATKYGDRNLDYEYNFQQNEFGICWGIGMEAMDMLQMGIYYQRGISDLFPDNPGNTVHQNVYFTLGWLF
jgi:aminopeptidase YwaD